MTQEATSAPDSGQLPSALPAEIEAAIDRLIEAQQFPWQEQFAARAELTAKLLKWRDEEVKAALKANAESISAALWGSR